MWHERRLTFLAPGPWMLAGIWVWIWPAVAMVIWLGGQPRIGWGSGILQTGIALAAALGLRGLGALTYNATAKWHGGMVLLQEGRDLVAVPVGRSLGAVATLAVPFGLGMSVIANGLGWSLVLPHHWLWVTLASPLAALLFGLGSLWLYNRWVVVFYGSLPVQFEPTAQGFVVAGFDAHKSRLVAAMLLFSWVVILLAVTVLGLLILLTVLAKHLPAGYFGLGVAIFTGFFLAGVGFLMAVLGGWWCYLGAIGYRRWYRRGGGIRVRMTTREVPL